MQYAMYTYGTIFIVYLVQGHMIEAFILKIFQDGGKNSQNLFILRKLYKGEVNIRIEFTAWLYKNFKNRSQSN